MSDLLAGVRPPKPAKKPEPAAEKPKKASWQDFNDLRTVDDSIEGCAARLNAIDIILDRITEYLQLGAKKRRVYTRMSEST